MKFQMNGGIPSVSTHKLTVNDHYHAAVIGINGKFFGSRDGEAYEAILDELKKQGKTQVVIDLAEAELMDSTAIGLLIASATTMRREGGDIRLANMKKRLRNLFLMTRLLGSVFDAYDALDAALASYQDEPETSSVSQASA